MRNLKENKYVLIGFLLGILFSGLLLLVITATSSRSEKYAQPLQENQSFENYSTNQLFQYFVDNEKININKASMDELMNLPGIGEAKANSIIEFRIKYGDFEEIEELSYVSGIGDKLLESLQEMVTIGRE